jgi:dTDP-4-dehydrorhamnose 3,5-epimerase
MLFQPTKLQDAYLIAIEPVEDERGFFARTWCRQEFAAHGLETRLVQCNLSFNKVRGTLRGMHYQLSPSAETKLVRCIRGAIYDVAIDLRPESPTYRHWTAVTLSAENRLAFYIPQGFAHGFQSLTDEAEIFYQMSDVYAPDYARGIRWNDPAFAIDWPLPVTVISAKDQGYPDFVG